MDFKMYFYSTDVDKVKLFSAFYDYNRQDYYYFNKVVQVIVESGKLQLISEFLQLNGAYDLQDQTMERIVRVVAASVFEEAHVRLVLAVVRQLSLLDLKPSRWVQLCLNDQQLYLSILTQLSRFASSQLSAAALECVLLLDYDVPLTANYYSLEGGQYQQLLAESLRLLKNRKQPEEFQTAKLLKLLGQAPADLELSFAAHLLMKTLSCLKNERSAAATKSVPESLKNIVQSSSSTLAKLILIDGLLGFKDHKETIGFAAVAARADMPQARSVLEKVLLQRIVLKINSNVIGSDDPFIIETQIAKKPEAAIAVFEQWDGNLGMVQLLNYQVANQILCGLYYAQRYDLRGGVIQLAEAVYRSLAQFNSVKTTLFSFLVTQLQVYLYVSEEASSLPYLLYFSEAAKQISLLYYNSYNDFVFSLAEVSQFTSYTAELGGQTLKIAARKSVQQSVFPLIEGQISFIVAEPAAKLGELQQRLSETTAKYNKLLSYYQQQTGQRGLHTGGGQNMDDEARKELQQLKIAQASADTKIQSLENLNRQLSEDKKTTQLSLDMSNKTNEVLQGQLANIQQRMEEIQARKIDVDREVQILSKQTEELRTANYQIGEQYRAARTAIAQIKSVVDQVK